MKVKLNESIAGTRPDNDEPFSFGAGEVVDVPNAWAKSLLDGGIASAVSTRDKDAAEKRVQKPAETR